MNLCGACYLPQEMAYGERGGNVCVCEEGKREIQATTRASASARAVIIWLKCGIGDHLQCYGVTVSVTV